MITIRPIRTEDDYTSALELLETLLECEEGSEEEEQLEVLSILIEDYEKRNHPIPLPTPIGAIKFRMEQGELKQKDLIPFIGSGAKVSEVLSGKRQLTLKMIRALHTGLGIPLESLIGEPEAKLPEGLEDLEFEKFPIKEMLKERYFEGVGIAQDLIDDYKNRAEEIIRTFVNHIGGQSVVPMVQFRKNDTCRMNAQMSNYALTAWCMKVIDKANQQQLPVKYDSSIFNDDQFISQLVSLSAYDSGVLLAKEHLEKHGIHLVYLPHLKKTHLDGASFMLKGKTPVVAVTGRYDRLDNFWFVLLHELGHICKHFREGSKGYFIDDLLHQEENEQEKEADEFAESALIPDTDFALDTDLSLTPKVLVQYANKLNIHPAIVAGRWQYTQKNYKKFSNLVGRNEVREQLRNV